MVKNAKSIAKWTGGIIWLLARGFIEIGAALLVFWGGLAVLKYPWPKKDWVFYGVWVLIYLIIDFVLFTVPLLRHRARLAR